MTKQAEATLTLFRVDDGGETHYAVADSPEAAIQAVSEALIGGEGSLMDEYPETKARHAPEDETLEVHYASCRDIGLEVAGRSDGLEVDDEVPDDWGVPYVSGPPSAWVEAYREQAPAFVSSTVF